MVAANCVASELHANGETKLLERETFAEVERAIDRRLFELRHREGMRWEEVVGQVGMSERTARDRCDTIRERLRHVLERRGR